MFRPARMAKIYCVFPVDMVDTVLQGVQSLGTVQFFDIKDEISLEDMEVRTDECLNLTQKAEQLLSDLSSTMEKDTQEKIFGPKVRAFRTVAPPGKDTLQEMGAGLDWISDEYGSMEKEKDGLQKDLSVLVEELEQEVKDLIPDSQKIARYEAEIEDIRKRLANLEGCTSILKRKYVPEVLVIKEVLENLRRRQAVVKNLGRTDHTATLGGYVIRDDLQRTMNLLRRATGGMCIIESEDVHDDAPVVLENPPILRPYEILTKGYGLPGYNDLDPTPFLAITFTMLFGIMFADMGYGFTLMMVSLLAFSRTTGGNEFMRDLNMILFYAGSASFVFGALFGEFFGGIFEVSPLLMDPRENVELLLFIALMLGISHISLSAVSRIINNFLTGRPIMYHMSLLMIMWPTFLLIFLPTLVPWLMKISILTGILFLAATKKLEVLGEVIALFTNILSYARLTAILLIHVIVARLLAQFVLGLPKTPAGIIFGLILFVVGAFLILATGVLMVFIQSLRLHWLEFFKRFYSGVGEKYMPLIAERKYTYVVGK